jgi:diadenosine tetraphosphate (Ap4A) HIT family hydrolase
MKTIFEKIIDREIPADIIYEDDVCMAFLDINPVRKDHTLIVTNITCYDHVTKNYSYHEKQLNR